MVRGDALPFLGPVLRVPRVIPRGCERVRAPEQSEQAEGARDRGQPRVLVGGVALVPPLGRRVVRVRRAELRLPLLQEGVRLGGRDPAGQERRQGVVGRKLWLRSSGAEGIKRQVQVLLLLLLQVVVEKKMKTMTILRRKKK